MTVTGISLGLYGNMRWIVKGKRCETGDMGGYQNDGSADEKKL